MIMTLMLSIIALAAIGELTYQLQRTLEAAAYRRHVDD
jgi:hypothetical protein